MAVFRRTVRARRSKPGSASDSASSSTSMEIPRRCWCIRGTESGVCTRSATTTVVSACPSLLAMESASSASSTRRSNELPNVSSLHKVARSTARSGPSSRESGEGRLQHRDLLLVHHPEGAEEAPVVAERRLDESVAVAQGLGPAGRVQERLTEGGDPSLALSGAEVESEVDRQGGVRPEQLVEQLDGLEEVAHGVGRGERGQGGLARLAGVGDGLVRVHQLGGVEPVVGQLADAGLRVVSAEVLQGLGHLAVDAGPPGGPQLPVQGVLHEGVGEAVAPGDAPGPLGPPPRRRRRRGGRAARPRCGWSLGSARPARSRAR